MMYRSTDVGIALGDLSPETRRSLAKIHDVAEKDLAGVFANPVRLAETLRQYSPATLLAIHELLLLGTEAHEDELAERIAEHLGTSAEQVDVEDLFGGVHLAGVCYGTVGGIPSAFLIQEAAKTLHQVMWALPFPPRSEKPSAPTSLASLSAERVRSLALLGRLAQHSVKLTQSNNVNRTSLRTFVKHTPFSRDEAEKLLEVAHANGLCREYDGRLVPLRDFILGQAVSKHPLDGYVREVVEREEAVPLIALRCAIDRLCAEGADVNGALSAHGYVRPEQRPALIEDYLARLSFVKVHEGWVFPRAAVDHASKGTAPKDGFVTPAFDVMVAQSASEETLLEVAMAAEISSLDRMSTFCLTPKSVQAAVRFGLTGQDILAALERVGAQPVPGNVRAMVAEWAADAPVVRARRAWIVEGDDAALEARLGASARLSPGCFEVRGDMKALTEQLQKLQLNVPVDSTELDARTESGPAFGARYYRSPLPSWRPPTFFGDDAPRELADRLRAARRGEEPWLIDPDLTDGALEPFEQVEACFDQVLDEARRDLDTASKRWSRANQSRLVSDPNCVVELRDFLTLTSKWRRRAMKRASTPEELIAESRILASAQRLSGPGRAYFEAMDAATKLLRQAADAAGDPGEPLETESMVVPHTIGVLKGLVDAEFLVELLFEGPKGALTLRGSIRGIKTHRNEPAHLLFENPSREQGRAIPISKIRRVRVLDEPARALSAGRLLSE